MVASVIEELSPKDERTKLLREKLAIIQEAQVSALSAGFAAASHLQLLCRDALLKNFGFQPQVMSTVNCTVRGLPCARSRAQGPSEPSENHQTGWQDGWVVSLVHQEAPWVQVQHESDVIKEDCFQVFSLRLSGTSYCHHDPENSDTGAALSRRRQQGSPPPTLSRQPQEALQVFCGFLNQTTLTGPRWGFAWQTLPHTGGVCWATAGPPALFRTGGHCIPAMTSAHPSVHQLLDQKQPAGPPASRVCLAAQGSSRAGHQCDIPRVLQPVVPGPKEDSRSVACYRSLHSQPPHGSSTLQDGDARVHLFSHQKSGLDGIDRHTRCLLHVPMHQAIRKYLRFVVNKKVY